MRLILLASFATISCGIFTGCNETTSTRSAETVVRTNADEKLRHAVDAFKIDPSPAAREAVEKEFSALSYHIQLLEDKALVADQSFQPYLETELKALRSVLKFNLERMNTPTPKAPAEFKAAKAEPEPLVARAIAVLPAAPVVMTAPETADIPVRRATVVNAQSRFDKVTVRRAVAVMASEKPARIAAMQSDSRALWHPMDSGDGHLDLARR